MASGDAVVQPSLQKQGKDNGCKEKYFPAGKRK